MLLTSSWITDITIFIAFVSFWAYKYLTRNFDYWEQRKIPYPKPLPLFGNFYEVFTFKMTIHERMKKLYDQIDAPYFGIFILDEPVLVLKDPKLIKDILIKDFAIFCNRRPVVPVQSLMAKAIFFLKNPEWKQVRIKLTPVFTSAMLKNLHNNHLTEICNSMTTFLKKNKGILDGKRVGELFSSELVIKFVYGANSHCFDEKPSAIESVLKNMSAFSLRNAIIQNLYFIKPSWVIILQLNFISESILKFFEGVFKQVMEARSHYDGKPQNFVDFANKALREKQCGKEDVLELQMSISTALSFLIAGKDTLTTQISFTLYEIAMNESIQTKLRNEIKENVKMFGGITYEGVHQNKYLEMCIKETTRKYPAVPFLDRVPIADYKFDGIDLVVEKDMTVVIPSYALHREEIHFPHSEVYDPERFREDMTSEGLTNIPFGAGPRSCIGKRLGVLSLLVALSYIVYNFKIEKCPETPTKIEFEPKSFALSSKVGLPLKITPIGDEKI
ncbi:cytochrome P450 6k1-like [Diabrotica undecimpunctata]|uniref:cytochrome P450 6k1-like n=1 Tax=Diabrotica undecimpunctata TaxID=50387 RepID=UPI003B633778